MDIDHDIKQAIPLDGPAVDVPTPANWENAERQLSINLPADFRAIVSWYGTGFFGGFLTLLNPAASAPHFNLIKYDADVPSVIDIAKEYLATMSRSLPSEDLVCIGYTINGDELFYCMNGRDPVAVLIANTRGADCQVFYMSISELIAGLVSGGIRSTMFPDNAFLRMPGFQRAAGSAR